MMALGILIGGFVVGGFCLWAIAEFIADPDKYGGEKWSEYADRNKGDE